MGATATADPGVKVLGFKAKAKICSRGGNAQHGMGEAKAQRGTAWGGGSTGDSCARVVSADARPAGAGGVRQPGTLAPPNPRGCVNSGHQETADQQSAARGRGSRVAFAAAHL